MITVLKLIAVLFHVITIVTSNPNIPADVKSQVVDQVIQAVADENGTSVETVPVAISSPSVSAPASTELTGGATQSLPAAASPVQGNLGTISVANQASSDGSYAVTADLKDANRLFINMKNTAHNDDWNFSASVNHQNVSNIYDKGFWTYSVVSYDVANNVMGTTTGSFNLE